METINKVYYTIKRETSKYNKYMKWHLELYHEDKSLLSSEYCKTRKLAQNIIDRAIDRGRKGFPIGNRLSYSEYFEMEV